MIYAILHKPTGVFLPEMQYARGGTYTELTDKRPPRLFSTRTAAANALRHWLAGILSTTWVPDQSSHDIFGEGDYKREILPQPHRKAEEMEIVQVNITVVG